MEQVLTLQRRIELMEDMGRYMLSDEPAWQEAMQMAGHRNAWFTAEHIAHAVESIARQYLAPGKLPAWVGQYKLPAEACTVGIVMAGNIPLVGFHDMLCGFMSGHRLMLKLSTKDEVLMRHLLHRMVTQESLVAECITVAERLNGCDAYIATGSNNTARYFEQYFGKYPHIIRQNRTSVAILDGSETDKELVALADDVYLYYGLGCRNVTQVCVPHGYDFERLLRIFARYDHYADLNKYKNNYDYHLALYLLNRVPYMSTPALLMVENELPFSAVSVLHYRHYTDREQLVQELQGSTDIQAIIGHGLIPFGSAQVPTLTDYADGVDTMAFLCSL
ncbi:acyl-CoA reductase [Nemorincola caseinilytica]|uniref:Acyl-CoA reductase n=1 Tax=Nemorincola caseinilytica TaxID=2054315 RepID=A0ABP8NI81_9BACT